MKINLKNFPLLSSRIAADKSKNFSFRNVIVGNKFYIRSLFTEGNEKIYDKKLSERSWSFGCKYSNVLMAINKPWDVKWTSEVKEDVKKWLCYTKETLECNQDYFYVHIEKLGELAENKGDCFDDELVKLAKEAVDFLRKNRSWDDPVLSEVYNRIVWRDSL